MTFVRYCKYFLEDEEQVEITPEILKDEFLKPLDELIYKNDFKGIYAERNKIEKLVEDIYKKYCNVLILGKDFTRKMLRVAERRTVEETEQSFEALVHNLCSMASRAGSQTPFSSVNFGLCTSWEGRLVSKSLMKAQYAGLGLGETAIFPISIFKMKKGVTDKGSPNYDLFLQACKTSAFRLYPNFLNVDAPFNLKWYQKDKPETHASAMGCAHGCETVIWRFADENRIRITTFELFWLRCRMHFWSDFKAYSDTSYYLDVENKGVEIYDSYTGDFVKVKKVIRNEDVTNWRAVTFSNHKTIILTSDHPVPVEGKGRTRVEDLVEGDEVKFAADYVSKFDLSSVDPITKQNLIVWGASKDNAVTASVVCVSLVEAGEHTPSFDVETETDRFDISAMYSHNCRTRVIENHYDPEHCITEGRGNLFWTTMNLPYLALEAREESIDEESRIKLFFEKLDHTIENVIQYSLDRFEVVAKRRAKNYPFMIGQHEYVNSEGLMPEDEIREVIKEGTMAVGFIGLAETLVALIGKHHGESEEAQELGLKIIGHIKQRTEEASEKYNLNFGTMASPAEGCTGRLLRITRKRFGTIPGITDKGYFTNSFHINPTYKLSAWKKVALEAPYHEICTSGAITYVEQDSDIMKNPQAFEELVNYIADSGCGYFAINHPMTRDPICGYVGPMNPDGTCPRCGRKEFEGVAASKLMSLVSYSPDPEYAVTAAKLEDVDKTINTL